jgi:hypothetical protein
VTDSQQLSRVNASGGIDYQFALPERGTLQAGVYKAWCVTVNPANNVPFVGGSPMKTRLG